jgi:glycosyltransferase involved in cell wall biosynthesis
MKKPRISIVMPVYNSEKFVAESIQSLLDQTYGNFELMIVDDGSTDATGDIIAGFKDSRIKVLKNDKNRGIVYSRNRGLAEISGEYYAPFDSDDVASKDKFEKQVDFLDNHPEYALIGSWSRLMDEKGHLHHRHWKLDAKPEMIPSIMLFRNYFVHSSVLIRRQMMGKIRYLPGYDIGEDYILLAQLAFKHPVYNYPEFLTNYRIHSNSAMRSDDRRMFELDIRVYRYLFSLLEIKLSDSDLNCIFVLKEKNRIKDIEMLRQVHDLLIRILRRNMELNFFSHAHLQKTVANRWLKACYLAKNQHLKMFTKLVSSPLTRLLFKP